MRAIGSSGGAHMGGWTVRHLKGTSARTGGPRLLILLGAALATGGGCVGFPDDVGRLERDVARLRQEMATLARNNDAARAMIEERLRRLEGRRREAAPSPAPQAVAPASPGVQAELDQRLHELLGEYRMVQGRLEENSAALEQLQRRVDALERRR